MLRVGIVGLPNVGKSTLFNALLRQAAAPVASYPFTTIEPNVGRVAVPDERLEPLARLARKEKIVPAVVEFVDIAGLVRGASKGEGLGNQFLAHIRETDALVHVIRCFKDESVAHAEGSIDPRRDVETIEIELALADLATLSRRREKALKGAKASDKHARAELEVLDKLEPALEQGKLARKITLSNEEGAIAGSFFLLTTKPTIFAANVDEATLADPGANQNVSALRKIAAAQAANVVVICAQVEAELAALPADERRDYLASIGVTTSGVDRLIKSAYDLLGLLSFLTTDGNEVRAWAIPRGTHAPQAAGLIHSDMQRGFIRAEVISYDELMRAGSYAAAREQGCLRLEGKDYLMQEGDVAHFRFSV